MSVNKDFQQVTAPPPQIKTAAERDKLVRDRAKPEPVNAPVPPHIIQADLKHIGERQRESRIRHLNQKLHLASGVMRRDRLRAVNKGRAKASFNHKSKDQGRSR